MNANRFFDKHSQLPQWIPMNCLYNKRAQVQGQTVNLSKNNKAQICLKCVVIRNEE